MLRAVRAELLKLKGARIVLWTALAAASFPLFTTFTIRLIDGRADHTTWDSFMRTAPVTMASWWGLLVFGLAASYLFGREYTEGTAKNLLALPVVDEGRFLGLVTEGDLIVKDIKLEYPTYIHLLDGFIMYPPSTTKFEHELKKAVAARVADVMTAEPVTVQADASVEDVATLLVEGNISRLPVLDGDGLVGIVTKSDVLRSMIGS